MLIFGVLSFNITPFSLLEVLLVRYSNACLRLFVVVLQDLHCLQRFYHNVDHWGITLYHHNPNSSRTSVSKITVILT